MALRSLILVLATTVTGFAPVAPAAVAQDGSADGRCPVDLDSFEVPGAEYTQAVCLDDLTTFSNERRATSAGTRDNAILQSKHTDYPEQAVPGIQIEGWFPDGCDRYEKEPTNFVPACPGGFRHNSQFVIRIPFDWDGEHLVVTGAPGVRDQWASDLVVGDWITYRGWAYASHDKGNTGLNFFRAGDSETDGSAARWVPPKAMEEWAPLMEQTALAAQAALEELMGSRADLTYASGISNGGYQTRLAVERYPEVFDGGVDWEGTLIRPDAPNIFTDVPVWLQNYPRHREDPAAYQALVHEGHLPPWSERVWDHHYFIYWGPVASAYRPVIDPEYTDYVAVPRTPVLPGDPDAQYDYESRPDFVRERMALIANTGDTHGRPFITLGPTLDALLPIATHASAYADMVRAQGHGDSFRYYVVEGGTHVDKLTDDHTDVMRPLLACYVDAIDELDRWVTTGQAPAPSGFVPFPSDATPEERANTCQLPTQVDRVAGATRVETAIAASRGGYTYAPAAVIAAAGDFPDALAAAPLAAHLGGPVLLADDASRDAILTELDRLGPVEVVIVGGSKAVSAELESAIAEGGDWTVRRVAGADRFATAAAIAAELPAGDDAIVVTGRRFPDALSAAPFAARTRTPILLTEPDRLPSATVEAIAARGVDRTTIIGGTGAVSDAVADRLPSPERIAGPDRYATSIAVVRAALAGGHRLDQLSVATGRSFPDALAAGPVAVVGYGGAVGDGLVLLVDDTEQAGGTLELIRRHAADIEQVLVYGGSATLGPEVVDAIRAAAGG